MTDILEKRIEELVDEIPGMKGFLYTGCPEPEMIATLLELISEEDQCEIVDATDRGKFWKDKMITTQKQCNSLIKENREQYWQIYHLNNKLTIFESMLNEAREELAKLKSA